MADTDPTSSVPAPDAGAPPAERAPDAEPKEAPSDPVPSAVEQEPVKEGKIPEEKPSGEHIRNALLVSRVLRAQSASSCLLLTSARLSDDTAASPQEQKEQQETPSEVPAAPAEPSDAKEPEAPQAEPAAPAEPAPTEEANGTPASAKKGKSSKRRSSGIAEHKSKQNKKKPQTRVTHLNAKPGEYYLSRLRSYPAWPSIICDEEMLPQSILETRPVTAMRPDGTYREDYADEGRRAHERTFPVMFFGTNEL